MISITTQRFIIVYTDVILQKKYIFSSCKKFSSGCGSFWLLSSWPFWPVFLLNILFIFSNTLLIFKVIRWNRNLTKLDVLTSLSSNITAQTFLRNEHLKKKKKTMFYLHFDTSNYIVIFSHFIFNIKKILFHIWNLHKIYVLNKFFFIYPWLS